MSRLDHERRIGTSPRFGRRHALLAGAFSTLGALLPDQQSVSAGGFDCNGMIRMGGTSEVVALQPLLSEHIERTQGLAERFFNPTLVRLGVTAKIDNASYSRLLPSELFPLANDYILSTDMQVSQNDVIDVVSLSRYSRNKRLLNTAYLIPLKSVDAFTTTKKYTIHGINNFLTGLGRGEPFLDPEDFEKALRGVFNLPTDIDWTTDLTTSDLELKEGEFTSPNGELVTFSANSKGVLILSVELPVK